MSVKAKKKGTLTLIMNVTTTLRSSCIVAVELYWSSLQLLTANSSFLHLEFLSQKLVGRKSEIDVPLKIFRIFVENIAEKSIRSGK